MNWTYVALALFLLVVAYVLVFQFPSKADAPLPLPRASAESASTKPSTSPQTVRPNKVIDLLGNEAADVFLGKKEPGILMAYAPWCGHCKNMMPAFESASTKTNVRFARIEGSSAQLFMQKYEIRGFPTLLTVNKDGVVAKYASGRDETSLVLAAEALAN
jgi:hypothetical protein